MAASQDFDTLDYLARTATNPKDDFTFPMAFACHFNADVVSGGSKYIMAIWKTSNYFGMRINSSNITIIARENAASSTIEICGSISDSTWYHCVINFVSATERTLYLDGAQYGSTATVSADPITYGFNQVEVGAIGGVSGYDGKVAYPAMYNKELSLAEINEIRFKPYSVTDSLLWAPNMLIDGSVVGDYKDLSGFGYDPDAGTVPAADFDGPPVQFY